MNKYDPKQIEPKWQAIWEETGLYKTPEKPKKPFYNLVMFPYPSGKLHVGHWYNFGPADTLGRFARMQGYDVLQPLGYDAFGLPAENAAIKNGVPADKWTADNVAEFRRQYISLGGMYDMQKDLDTSKPEYYRWTQWLFLQLYKAGKAVQKEAYVNWDPVDKTVLANEQVINGKADRSGATVERKLLKQWFFTITDYADDLLNDLDDLDWPEQVKIQQRNWIGKSEGASIHFTIEGHKDNLEVFTTRADTLFGATFMVVAPEHPILDKIVTSDQRSEVDKYQEQAGKKTDLDRMSGDDKTGVFTGSYAINPVNSEKIPIWVADYVLMGYGTGAIMAVPAHDERDFAFANKYELPVKQVISGDNVEHEPYLGSGILMNSDEFDGFDSERAIREIIAYLESKKIGKKVTNYRLRDWLISRQRYWGAPIPIIYCDKCGVVPVPESDLPVVLPLDQKMDKSGRSPLLTNKDFLNVECPTCGSDAKRETDTMDTFVDSSWYYLRYPNVGYDKGAFDPDAVKTWLPVDRYMGGVEHAILHLLYSRFITKFLYEQKLIDFTEPFTQLINQGLILGPDGNKMSKSKGNVIDPAEYVDKYGSDALRLYLMFMGPYEEGGPWDSGRFEGTYRFIGKVWDMVVNKYDFKTLDSVVEAELQSRLHKTIKKVSEDLNDVKFNTAISAMMEFVNFAGKLKQDGNISAAVWQDTLNAFTVLLAPFAPHLCEELWEILGYTESAHLQPWPKYDPQMIKDDVITIVIQVNGKLRGEFAIETGASQEELEKKAIELNSQYNYTKDQEIVKTIVVPNRLVNFVVKQAV